MLSYEWQTIAYSAVCALLHIMETPTSAGNAARCEQVMEEIADWYLESGEGQGNAIEMAARVRVYEAIDMLKDMEDEPELNADVTLALRAMTEKADEYWKQLNEMSNSEKPREALTQSTQELDNMVDKFLAAKGADKCQCRASALMCAAVFGDMTVIRYLREQGMRMDAKTRTGENALMGACFTGDLNMMQYLVEHGANVNDKDSEGWTALMQAADAGCMDVVQWLLQHGASVEDVAKDGMTVLHLAARSEDLEMVRFFMEHGATVTEADKRGWTAFLYAASAGRLEAMQYLLEHGASVSDKIDDGSTALHLAAEQIGRAHV